MRTKGSKRAESGTLLEHRIVNTGASDQLAALSVFERGH